MQNLFIEEDDVVEIKFSVATGKGVVFCNLSNDDLIRGIKDMDLSVEDYEIKDYIANFKRPSFGDTMGLYDSVFTTVDGQNVSFNPIAARFRKIVLLIKDWNLTGEATKPTENEIRRLHPAIAATIGAQLDVETGGLLG